MKIIPLFAGMIILNSTVFADVREQNGEEKVEKKPSIIVNNGANLLTESNYPNPFWATSSVSFTLSKDERVKVELFSITGQLVKVLADTLFKAGTNRIVYDGSGVSSGIYIYRISTPDTTITGKMVFLK